MQGTVAQSHHCVLVMHGLVKSASTGGTWHGDSIASLVASRSTGDAMVSEASSASKNTGDAGHGGAIASLCT
eukprot:7457791-Karenia_brevis.AAC.1